MNFVFHGVDKNILTQLSHQIFITEWLASAVATIRLTPDLIYQSSLSILISQGKLGPHWQNGRSFGHFGHVGGTAHVPDIAIVVFYLLRFVILLHSRIKWADALGLFMHHMHNLWILERLIIIRITWFITTGFRECGSGGVGAAVVVAFLPRLFPDLFIMNEYGWTLFLILEKVDTFDTWVALGWGLHFFDGLAHDVRIMCRPSKLTDLDWWLASFVPCTRQGIRFLLELVLWWWRLIFFAVDDFDIERWQVLGKLSWLLDITLLIDILFNRLECIIWRWWLGRGGWGGWRGSRLIALRWSHIHVPILWYF